MMRAAAVAAIAVASAAPLPAQRPPEPTLAVVLQRAGAYVADLHHRVTGIVAEEHYVQDAHTPRSAFIAASNEHRELSSDLLLVNVSGTSTWLEFRDVYAVDGTAVRDRTDRLTSLFLNPPSTAQEQIEAILAESARYNVGSIERTVNTPMFPLAFLEERHRPRFKFFRTNDRLPAAAKIEVPRGSAIPAPFRPPDGAWVIRFEETARPTVIHTRGDHDLPSHGRFWIDPDSGHVLMTEVVAEDRNVRGTLTVSYQSQPVLGLLLPAAMRERYEGRRSKVRVDAAATYGRFRQFQVNVDETFFVKKK